MWTIVYLQIGESIHGVPTGINHSFIGMRRLCPHLAAIRSDRSRDGDQMQFALSRFNEILAIQNELPNIIPEKSKEQSRKGRNSHLQSEQVMKQGIQDQN